MWIDSKFSFWGYLKRGKGIRGRLGKSWSLKSSEIQQKNSFKKKRRFHRNRSKKRGRIPATRVQTRQTG